MTNNKMVRGLVAVLAFSVTIPAAATEWAKQPNANIITTWKKTDTKIRRLDQADLDAQLSRLNQNAIQMMKISQPKKTKAECAELELTAIADTMSIRPAPTPGPNSSQVLEACKSEYGVQINPIAMKGLGKEVFWDLYNMQSHLDGPIFPGSMSTEAYFAAVKGNKEKHEAFLAAMASGNSSTEVKENMAPYFCETSDVQSAIERFNDLAQDLKGFRDQYIEELKKVEANEKAQKSWPAYTDGTDKYAETYTVSNLVTMYDMDALLSAPNLYDANIRGECVVNKSKKGYVHEKICVSAGLAAEQKDGFGATERQALAQKILSNRRSNELLHSLKLEMKDGDGIDLVRQVARLLDVQPSEVEKRCKKVIADRDSGKKTFVAKTEAAAKPASSKSDSQL